MYRFFIAGAIYQLDRSALRMGVLPFRIRELPKCIGDAMVELIVCALHPVARTARVGTAQSLSGSNVEQQRQIRHQAAGGKAIGGANFILRQSATEDLVGIRRKEKPVYQDNPRLRERRNDLSGNQLSAGGHEEQSF